MENIEQRPLQKNRMKTPTTAEVLRNILDRIMSGEELPDAVAEYRHVAGEISAWGAKFAEALRRRDARRNSRPSNAVIVSTSGE